MPDSNPRPHFTLASATSISSALVQREIHPWFLIPPGIIPGFQSRLIEEQRTEENQGIKATRRGGRPGTASRAAVRTLIAKLPIPRNVFSHAVREDADECCSCRHIF
jgi:hypothetical protein